MADNLNFVLYDPLEHLEAGFASGGGGTTTIVTSGMIATGAVTSGAIATGAVTSGAIATGAVTSGAIATGAVTSGAIATGAVTSGAIATGAIASSTLFGPGAYAGTSQFGVIEFDVTSSAINPAFNKGDLRDSGEAGTPLSGIARINQPPLTQSLPVQGGFDDLGNFTSTKVGSIIGTSVTNGTDLLFHNLRVRYPTTGAISLQIAVDVLGSGGVGNYILGTGKNSWLYSTTVANSSQAPQPPQVAPAAPLVSGQAQSIRAETRDLRVPIMQTPAFQYLSIAPQLPMTSFPGTDMLPWDNSESTQLGGAWESYEIYVNDGTDNAAYRITSFYFSPKSFIIIQRLQ